MDDTRKISPPEEVSEAPLWDYLIIIAKHGRLIIFTTLAVVILTYCYKFCSPNIYEAKVRLLPPHLNLTLSGQLLELMGGGSIPGKENEFKGLGGLAGRLLGLNTVGDIYVGIMKGDTVCNNIIKRFNLEKIYKTRYLEDARDQLRGNAAITPDPRSSLISIEVKDKDPKLAVAIAEAYPKELDKILRVLTRREAEDRLVFLEKERLLAAANLSKAEEALRSFSEKANVIQIDAQTKEILKYIAELRASIDAKEIQIQVLEKQATPMNYDLIKMQTELKGLKEKLQAAEKTQQENCIGDVCLPASSTPKLGLDYLRLYREVKFQESLYQLFTKISELARLDKVKDVVMVQVVDKANFPEKRANRRALPAIWMGLATFFVMIIASFGIEYAKNNLGEGKERTPLSILVNHIKKIYKKPI